MMAKIISAKAVSTLCVYMNDPISMTCICFYMLFSFYFWMMLYSLFNYLVLLHTAWLALLVKAFSYWSQFILHKGIIRLKVVQLLSLDPSHAIYSFAFYHHSAIHVLAVLQLMSTCSWSAIEYLIFYTISNLLDLAWIIASRYHHCFFCQAAHGGGKIILKGLYSGLAGNLAGVLPWVNFNLHICISPTFL
jgi:hypothetical protein